jgi:hypothetical protein
LRGHSQQTYSTKIMSQPSRSNCEITFELQLLQN